MAVVSRPPSVEPKARKKKNFGLETKATSAEVVIQVDREVVGRNSFSRSRRRQATELSAGSLTSA